MHELQKIIEQAREGHARLSPTAAPTRSRTGINELLRD